MDNLGFTTPFKSNIRAAKNASDDAALANLPNSTSFGDLPTHLIADELVAILGQIGDIYDTARLEGYGNEKLGVGMAPWTN